MMMKATIVLVGADNTQNYGRKLMLEAHRLGETGFEAARLPCHVSLKQTFTIRDFASFERFFDEFAETVKPVNIPMEQLVLYPNSSIGGLPSGCLALRATTTEELARLQKRLFQELEERFGPCPAMHDDNYMFHMTVAIGKAPYENYERAYRQLAAKPIPKELSYDKLAFFYYDDDALSSGTYFCYKICDISNTTRA